VLQPYCEGKAEVRLEGGTVAAVLRDLKQKHPELYRCVCMETGVVRKHVNVFVNDRLMGELDGMETPLAAGDVVSVFQSVSGG
jgi:molybdopterin synthase sulfur carrier subunit